MITEQTTFSEILSIEELSGLRPYLLGNCEVPDLDWTLTEMQKHFNDWDPEAIAQGLNAVIQQNQAGEGRIFDVYTHQEQINCPEKKDVKLFYMPGKPGKPFAVVCPGGGYSALCHLKESFPTGVLLNALGYHCFILNYRFHMDRLFPKPIDDLAAAVKFILSQAEQLRIDCEGYSVIGYSAGGHLCACFGTRELGAKQYGLPAPACVIGGYPLLSLEHDGKRDEILDHLCKNMFGTGFTEAERSQYSLIDKLAADYPSFYLWHCADDPLIPYEQSVRAAAVLKEYGVDCCYRQIDTGGHGFGPMANPLTEGWFTEAARLWEQNRG